MDPIAANKDYATIKGMFKTEDIVTPKQAQFNQDSQLTDYHQNNYKLQHNP